MSKPLSFVIITYNRPQDTLDLLKNIMSLEVAEDLLEEVIIVDNASTVSYEAVTSFVHEHADFPFKFIVASENLGVSRGRNFAVRQGRAPLIIMLDDDAEMGNKDCLVRLYRIFQEDSYPRPLALVSFKVVYFDSGDMQENAFPHKQFEERKDADNFPTYYFAGGAHAVKREVLDQVGLYPEDFFYGMEEYDLAYRIIDKGYYIRYDSDVVMRHKESPLGRKPLNTKLQMLWHNKAVVAWKYLPWIYFLSTAILWSVQYLRKSGFHVGGFLRTWLRIFRIPFRYPRKRISRTSLQYLEQVHARLWY